MFDYSINSDYLYDIYVIFNNIHSKIMHFLHVILIFHINIYIHIKYICIYYI